MKSHRAYGQGELLEHGWRGLIRIVTDQRKLAGISVISVLIFLAQGAYWNTDGADWACFSE